MIHFFSLITLYFRVGKIVTLNYTKYRQNCFFIQIEQYNQQPYQNEKSGAYNSRHESYMLLTDIPLDRKNRRSSEQVRYLILANICSSN